MDKMREVAVYVGLGLDADGIKDALNDSDEHGQESTLLFEVAHALLSEHKDDRAEVHSVDAEEVTIDPSHPTQVQIEFATSWSAYYGCRDMNGSGVKHECEIATYTSEGNLVFSVPQPRRPANDC